MDHYEELGLPRSSSTEEIRQAYKTLARVLHPDHQNDEELRRLAEIQMRRLNEILAMLTDPFERRKYDLSLEAMPRQRKLPHPTENVEPLTGHRTVRLRFGLGSVVWMLIGLMGLGSAAFYFTQETRLVPSNLPPADAGTPEPSAPSKTQSPVSSRRIAPIYAPVLGNARGAGKNAADDKAFLQATEISPPVAKEPKSSVAPEIEKNRRPPVEAQAVPDRPAEQLAVSAISAAPPPEAAKLSEAPKPIVPVSAPLRPAGLSGKWLYVKPKDAQDSKRLYPPEYIEMLVRTEAGLIHGRYRAKYKVVDQPISPEVNFLFEGKSTDGVLKLPWTGNGSAAGEVRLKRVSDDAVEVSWSTTRFGRWNTLASGTAVLVRSDAP